MWRLHIIWRLHIAFVFCICFAETDFLNIIVRIQSYIRAFNVWNRLGETLRPVRVKQRYYPFVKPCVKPKTGSGQESRFSFPRAAGDQVPLPPGVASFAMDHPPGRIIFAYADMRISHMRICGYRIAVVASRLYARYSICEDAHIRISHMRICGLYRISIVIKLDLLFSGLFNKVRMEPRRFHLCVHTRISQFLVAEPVRVCNVISPLFLPHGLLAQPILTNNQ
jgi:hypothetical protein